MDDGQDQDNYEERLKEVFNSFDASGSGSLSPEELTELCQSLHLDDATPALFQALLQNQDHLTARVPSVIFTKSSIYSRAGLYNDVDCIVYCDMRIYIIIA